MGGTSLPATGRRSKLPQIGTASSLPETALTHLARESARGEGQSPNSIDLFSCVVNYTTVFFFSVPIPKFVSVTPMAMSQSWLS